MTGSVTAEGDLYTDQVRRNSSNSTTTKINLDANAQKFYVGHSSNEITKITSDGLEVKGAISGSANLKTEGTGTFAGDLNITGTITAAGIASGSIAGAGSYVGLNSNNQLVLTASAGGGGGTDTNEFVITCQGFTYSHTSNTYFRTLPGSAGGIGYWTTAEAGQTTNAGDTLTIDYQLAGPSGATFYCSCRLHNN